MCQMLVLFIPVWIWKCRQQKQLSSNHVTARISVKKSSDDSGNSGSSDAQLLLNSHNSNNDDREPEIKHPNTSNSSLAGVSVVNKQHSSTNTIELSPGSRNGHNKHNGRNGSPTTEEQTITTGSGINININSGSDSSFRNLADDDNISHTSSNDGDGININTTCDKLVITEPIIDGVYSRFLTLTALSSGFLGVGGISLYIAMDSITVPTSMALSGLRAPFCYVLSILFLNEKLTFWKSLALISSVLGVLCFVFDLKSKNSDKNNNSDTHDTLSAIILLILSNFFIACNDITVKRLSNCCYHKQHPKYKLVGSFYFVSYQGLFSMVIGSFLLFYPWNMFDKNHWNVLFVENNGDNFVKVLILGLTLIVANVTAFVGITITSPVFINVGILLAIPMSFIVDIFVNNYVITLWSVLGALLLICAFLMLELIKQPKCCTWNN